MKILRNSKTFHPRNVWCYTVTKVGIIKFKSSKIGYGFENICTLRQFWSTKENMAQCSFSVNKIKGLILYIIAWCWNPVKYKISPFKDIYHYNWHQKAMRMIFSPVCIEHYVWCFNNTKKDRNLRAAFE